MPGTQSSEPAFRAPGDDITAYMGSEADVDGAITPADGWDQATAIIIDTDIGDISVRAKHDGINLYILFEVMDSDTHVEHIFFEDDGLVPDRVLDTVNEDCKYVANSEFPDGFRDASWNSGWTVEVGPNENGGANGSNSGANAVSEWWLPLSSGSQGDIDVDSNETLGFYATGALTNYDPGTWWEMHVIYANAPSDIQTPIADAGADVAAEAGEFAFFDGSGSSDDNGISDYKWLFPINGTDWILHGQTVLFLFTGPGTFIITLNVTDYAGKWDTDTVTAVVAGEPLAPDTNGTAYHYLFNGELELTETLLPGEYAIIEIPSGIKDIEASAAVITPQTYADFFVFNDTQLLTYLDTDISYMSYKIASRDVRVFEYATNSTERLYLVVDNTDLTSGGADGSTTLTFTVTLIDTAPDPVDSESLGEMFCWGLGGIFAFMAITTTYWLLSSPKKGAMGEPLTKEGTE